MLREKCGKDNPERATQCSDSGAPTAQPMRAAARDSKSAANWRRVVALCALVLALTGAAAIAYQVTAWKRSGQPALHWTANADHPLIARLLLTARADVNAKNKQGLTPLQLAVQRGRVGAVRVLLARGADVRVEDKRKNTPLHAAAERNHKEIAELLLVYCT